MPKVLIAPMTLAGLQGKFLEVLGQAGFEIVYPPKPVQLTEPEMIEQFCREVAEI